MNIATTDISAAARSASTGGGRLARALVAVALLGSLAGVSGASAAAGWPYGNGDQREQRGDGHGDRHGDQQRERPQAPPPMQREMQRDPQRDLQPQREVRQFDTRSYDMRLDEARRQQAQQQQDTGRRSGRMTPDERRELRRQINEAGMDLYPNTPRR